MAHISLSVQVLHGEDIYQAVQQKIEVCNLQGVVKKVLPFSEMEGGIPEKINFVQPFIALLFTGNPLHVDICGDFLVAVREPV